MNALDTHAPARRRGFALLLLLGLGIFAGAAATAQAQSVGTITGKVTDLQGKPLGFANILLIGTSWGAFTQEDGTYTVQNVPIGAYTVAVNMIGYEEDSVEKVQVEAGRSVTINFKIKDRPVGTLQEVEIVARREVIKSKRTDISHDITSKDVASLPVDELSELIGLKAGVIARGGELHFRGGRSQEVQMQVDGVPVRDPLVGSGVSLAALAVENTEVILGGLDAEYGNAQSGIINYKTKEGGDQFEGEVQYQTDDYGQPDNTFDNLDRVFVGVGGPSPVKNLTYYLSAEGTFQDNYPATSRHHQHTRILNFISVGDRKSNSVRFQGKLAFKPGSNHKLTFEALNNRGRSDVYYHVWSRVGYVQTFRDTTQTGDVVVRSGRWSPTPLDSTYQYYNPADHTPTYKNNFNQMKLVWSHTIDAGTYYTIKLNRSSFFNDARVQGKEAWEYSGMRERDLFFNYADNTSSDFFVVAGDYPFLATRKTRVYTGKTDMTHKMKRHTFQSGLEMTYNDMWYTQVDRPYNTNTLGEIGTRTRYHYYNPEGSWYLKDRWEHEGMILNIGLRYDVFSVGDQLSINEVRDPVKKQFSPRVGIAYPISDRDVFNFHYGRFYQIPDRQYIFDNRNVFDGRARGNPNLTNETTVSYQAGIQHLFNELVSGQFSVYYKDVFGQLSQEQLPALGSVGNLTYYVNKDYASSRGFEATLTRRFGNNFGGELNYGFSVATGVASDPNAVSQQSFTYYPISEQPLDWDIRHSLSATLELGEPGAWRSSFVWQYSSGAPYTPVGRNTRQILPKTVNSRRLPGATSLDIQAEKYYRVWGQLFRVFMQSRNVLDAKNITDLGPGNWPNPPASSGRDYEVYFTETGKGGGAYVGRDTNGDGIGDWVPVHDPRVFGDPRTVRMGVSYSF
jgi:outer membrane receptor for ferrienterochelin and colicin